LFDDEGSPFTVFKDTAANPWSSRSAFPASLIFFRMSPQNRHLPRSAWPTNIKRWGRCALPRKKPYAYDGGVEGGGIMTRGIITSRHILLHPFVLIGSFGLVQYLKMLCLSLDRKQHCFLDYLRFER
jgi:hypothetical protein